MAESVDGAVVVRVRGQQDGDSEGLPVLKEILEEAAGGTDAKHTVLDLSATGFVDSSFLHLLLNARHDYARTGKALVIAGPLPVGVRRLFEVTGTAGAFTHADTVDEALCDG
ncbi:STAS domain-containing protein [Streptomyces sp. NPDC088755]|uniref:STAS domain-containing protein n=1 Tax=Streptomyces sp. NPDC088755 TaxID=3365888 RepID=UPI0038059BAD